MTRRQVTDRLASMIEKREFKRFFDTIEKLNLSKGLLQTLHDEWDAHQFMISKGMIREKQAPVIFKTVFDKYEHRILTELDLDIATSHFKEYDDLISRSYLSDQEEPGGDRPAIISIFCIIYSGGLLASLFSIPVVIGHLSSSWLVLINLTQLGLGIGHISSLWQMKKWTLPVYFVNLLIGGLTLVIENSTNPILILFPETWQTPLLIFWGIIVIGYSAILLNFYSDME